MNTNKEEAKKHIAIMNEIQSAILKRGYFCSNGELDRFHECVRMIRSLGFIPKKRVKRVGVWKRIVTWYISDPSAKRARNSEADLIITNVRPDRKTLRGDCTTRALTFALEGRASYDEIEKEQYALGHQLHTTRNHNGTWERVAYKYGFKKISFNPSNFVRYERKHSIKRSVLGSMISKKIAHPIITHSTKHAAAIDTNGAVRDTWDSRGGRVTWLLVHKDDVESVKQIFHKNNIKYWEPAIPV